MIADGSRVYVSPLMGVPTTLLFAMVERAERWSRLETTCDYLLEPLPTFAAPTEPFHHLTVQPTAATAAMGAAGALAVVPAAYSQFASLWAPGGRLEVDVALVQVSEPGPDGRFSLGLNGGATPEVVRQAGLVIAEINPAMPYLRGAVECERSDFDYLVEVDHPLVELAPAAADEVAARIGRTVAELVPDGATIEYGVGAIPDAVLAGLSGHRDLGLHSGMIGDGVIELIESGVMNGRRKTIDPGLHVAAVAIGSRRLVEWLVGRDDVVMVASPYSHGIPALSRQRRFVAVNSAVEVAWDGSVNAETVGERVVSGPGGQPDFAQAAAISPEGMAVVALPATAGRGRFSRLVERLGDGAPTTVARHLADRVVTEYGVASLRGLDLGGRRLQLQSISHPGHR